MTDRLAEAFAYAAELHKDQVRKGSQIPYVSHLLAVAALVQAHGGDEDQAVAALLHDGPEDQGGEATLDEIRRRFGDRVADIVADCSDTFETPKPPWKGRKLAYLEHLQEAPEASLLVSLADKVHNLGSIVGDYVDLGDEIWSRFTGGRDGTLAYYRRLLEIFEARNNPALERLVDDLRRSLEELEALMAAAGEAPAS